MTLIKNIFEAPENQNILIIGAGSLSQSVIRNLYDKGIRNIKSVNRTIKKIKINLYLLKIVDTYYQMVTKVTEKC